MIAAGADPIPPFDPVESERKIKELVSDQVKNAFEVLRNELKGDMLTLNVKFDTISSSGHQRWHDQRRSY